jgi:hypothetical protein
MNEPLFPTGRMNRRLLALLRAVEALPPGQQMIVTRDNGGVRWMAAHPERSGGRSSTPLRSAHPSTTLHSAQDASAAQSKGAPAAPPPRPVEPDA